MEFGDRVGRRGVELGRKDRGSRIGIFERRSSCELTSNQ